MKRLTRNSCDSFLFRLQNHKPTPVPDDPGVQTVGESCRCSQLPTAFECQPTRQNGCECFDLLEIHSHFGHSTSQHVRNYGAYSFQGRSILLRS